MRPNPPSGFVPLLWGEGVSNFGSMLSRLAIPWLAALELNASPWAMGWLLVAQVGSGALAALTLAPWVDRSDKRTLMLRADVGSALVMAALALAHGLGALRMPGLVLAAAASGVLSTLFDLARSAWVGLNVPVAELPRRNAQLSAVGSVSETVAFASGGWLYQALGAVLALGVDALSFLGSALCLRALPRGRAPPADAGPADAGQAAVGDAAQPAIPNTRTERLSGRLGRFADESLEGWRAVVADRRLRLLAAIEALVAFGSAVFGACFMVFVARTLGYSPGLLGLVFALGGLGALLGAALAERLGRRLGAARAMALGLAALALGQLAPALAPAAGAGLVLGLALLVAQQIVGDGGQVLHEVHGRSLRQALPAPQMLARVDAGLRSLGHGATLLGALLGGAAATVLGERALLGFAALCALAAAALAVLALRPALAAVPAATAALQGR